MFEQPSQDALMPAKPNEASTPDELGFIICKTRNAAWTNRANVGKHMGRCDARRDESR